MPTKTLIQGIPMSHIAIGMAVMTLMIVIPALFNPKKFREGMSHFFDSGDTTLRVANLSSLLVAFLILNTHWTIKLTSTRSIMTVIGYLLLIRCFIWMWFPEKARMMMKRVLHSDTGFAIMRVLMVIFCLGFGYLGIWVY